VLALIAVGLATGLGRTINRDWGFVLERTAKGFRVEPFSVRREQFVNPPHGALYFRRTFRALNQRVPRSGFAHLHPFGWRVLTFFQQ
jgi:hypothetical protein